MRVSQPFEGGHGDPVAAAKRYQTRINGVVRRGARRRRIPPRKGNGASTTITLTTTDLYGSIHSPVSVV